MILGITSGCLKTTTKVRTFTPATLQTATFDELMAKLRRIGSVQSLKATVDLELSILNNERTKKETYQEVRGYVLGRRPNLVRIQAQVPVTRQKAFDMASDGSVFRVYLPWKQEFFEGDTAVDVRSDKRAENVRPQHVIEPILIEPPRDDETAVLDNYVEGITAYQVVQLLYRDSVGRYHIRRKAWFDRATLQLSRYEIYNDEGVVATRARYKEWTESASLPYARNIFVSRPLDGYDLAIRILEPGLNADVPDASFVLEAPEGIEIKRVGEDDKPQQAEAQ